MSMMMNVLPLDEKKRQLLEAKLQDHAAVVANGVITSPPAHVPEVGDGSNSSHTGPVQLGNAKEIINLDNSPDSASRSNSRLSFKENRRKENENGQDSPTKRPLELESTDSFDAMRDDKPTKSKRVDRTAERTELESPEPERAPPADSGSRGAIVKNTIKNYFPTQGDGASNTNSSFTHINKENKEVKEAKESKDGSSTPREPPVDPSSILMPPPAKVPAAKPAPSALQQQVTKLVELQRELEGLKALNQTLQTKVSALETDKLSLMNSNKAQDSRIARMTKALEDVHRAMAQQEFRCKREKLAMDNVRLGRVVSSRSTIGNQHQSVDAWEGGYRRGEIERQKILLKERKEELEARRKRIQTLRRQAKRGAPSSDNLADAAAGGDGLGGVLGGALAGGLSGAGAAGAGGAGAGTGNAERDRDIMDNDMDLNTETEVIKNHLEQLKKDELALAEEEKQFASERAVHHKEAKRIHCEECSEIYKGDLRVLCNRYLPQSLLGRGGFSEVWKALDLVELREVAVKVHQLNNQWSEERKQSYIRHVTREYTIHRDMKHPRVVQLLDVFEIGSNSFATVLEYCKGIDLDERLKRQKTIPEKDAKAIFMQIMSGLRYLDRPLTYGTTHSAAGGATVVGTSSGSGGSGAGGSDGRYYEDDGDVHGGRGGGGGSGGHKANKKLTIIHYDLKPANILFDELGDVKITDFGLSKIIDETSEGTSMELTSQGAGTYWYLPPECFVKGDSARISSKVDVWSAGVIFYQMLYGCRPYGEGQTQERVWNDGIIANAGEVVFPAHPKVSDEAKELIRACLTRDPRLRPDVVAVCQHAYLNK